MSSEATEPLWPIADAPLAAGMLLLLGGTVPPYRPFIGWFPHSPAQPLRISALGEAPVEQGREL